MNILKKIILKLFYIYWCVKTFIYFKIFGSYGVSNCIEIMPHPFIVTFLRKYGASIGEGCNIERGLILHRPNNKVPFKNLSIEDKVYIGNKGMIDLTAKVKIGNNTAFGANCQIWTHTGDWTWDRKDESEKVNSVLIGNAVIVYSGAIINQGVSIGNYSRIAAGSIVLRKVNERSVVVGIPAKEIRKREF